MKFAEFQLYWSERKADGSSRREDIEHAKSDPFATLLPDGEFKTDEIEAEAVDAGIVEVDCPVEIEYLWFWFLELNQARSGNGFGMNSLSYLEISTWAQLKRITLEPWEVGALKSLDGVYLTNYAKNQAAKK